MALIPNGPPRVTTRGSTRPTSRGSEDSRGAVRQPAVLGQYSTDPHALTQARKVNGRFDNEQSAAEQEVENQLRFGTTTEERPRPPLAIPESPEVLNQKRLGALHKSQAGSLIYYERELASALAAIDAREASYNLENPATGMAARFGHKAKERREALEGFERNRAFAKNAQSTMYAHRNKTLADWSKNPNRVVKACWAEGVFFEGEFGVPAI